MWGKKNGQTTMEFTVFLAIVLLILIILIATFTDLSFISSKSETTLEQTYFQSQPLAIGLISANTTHTTIYLWSNLNENITLHDVLFDSTSLALTEQTLVPRDVYALSSDVITKSTSFFSDREVEVIFNYTLVDSNQTFVTTYPFAKKVILE